MAESPGICRVCLREGEFMISVFEYEGTLNYCHKIMHCASINISEYDGFPSSICQECRTDLAVAYDFVIKCQDSDKNLREAKPILPIKVELEIDESDGGDYPEDDVKYEDDIKDILPENSIETILYVEKKKKSRKKESKKRKIKKESKDLQCAICGLIANSRAAMIVHMRRHTGERPYKCPVCDMHFSQTGTLKVHIERRHSKEPRELRDRPFSCETCGVRFFSKRDLLVHSRRHTGDHPYACEHCSQRFTQLGSLIRHRRTHTGERPYSCTLCRKSFTDSSVLRMHQSVHSDERRFTCNICGKAVKSKNALNKHINLHREYKPIICDQCGVGFSTKGNLTLHTKKQHSERSGHCDECGKHCSDIAEHMRKHTGDTAYACNVCGKSFPLKRSLSVHMHKHINADKHKCDKENCFKTFPKKFLLDFHQLKYHSNETPFVCKICTKGYLRASDLKKHMKVHHPTFPYDQ